MNKKQALFLLFILWLFGGLALSIKYDWAILIILVPIILVSVVGGIYAIIQIYIGLGHNTEVNKT